MENLDLKLKILQFAIDNRSILGNDVYETANKICQWDINSKFEAPVNPVIEAFLETKQDYEKKIDSNTEKVESRNKLKEVLSSTEPFKFPEETEYVEDTELTIGHLFSNPNDICEWLDNIDHPEKIRDRIAIRVEQKEVFANLMHTLKNSKPFTFSERIDNEIGLFADQIGV